MKIFVKAKNMKISFLSTVVFLLLLISSMNGMIGAMDGNVRDIIHHDGENVSEDGEDISIHDAGVINSNVDAANAEDGRKDATMIGKDRNPDILLVDDDQDPSWPGVDYESEQYYIWALNDGGYVYDYWNVSASGSVSLEHLNNYTIVIWFTGDARDTTLLSGDQTNISGYLDGGGKMFLSGEDIGYDIYEKNETAEERMFYENYLHALYHRDSSFIPHLKGAECDPIGNGSWIDLVAPSIGSHHPDVITPIDTDTTTVFGYTGNDTGFEKDAGAIRTDNGVYKMVYFSFRFGLISNNVLRNQTMVRIIDWFNLSGDTIPPTIEHVPSMNTSDTSGCSITAVIEDTIGVDTSTLKVYYSVDLGETYNELSMTGTVNPNEYEADIPGQSLGTTIYYYIQANDTSGNTARSPAIAPKVTHYIGIMDDLNVLIVNDDQGWVVSDPQVTVVTYNYIQTLNNLGINWDLWKTYYQGVPSASLLSSYDVVIWFIVNSGDTSSNGPLIEQSILNLKTFMDGGGHLFISGDIEFPLSTHLIGRELYEQYLHVRTVHNSGSMSNDFRTRVGIPSDPIGGGLYISTLSGEYRLQGDGYGYQPNPDLFYPLDYDPAVTKVFRHTSSYGGIGGVKSRSDTYSNVYIGFPFSRVNNPPDRDILMFRTLMWLVHGNEPIIMHYPLFDTEHVTGSYRVDAEINAPCNDLDTTSLKVYYSTGGSFSKLTMSSLGDNEYYADIPSYPLSTTIYYYIEANTTDGNTTRHPMNAKQTDLSTCCNFLVRELADILLVDDDCGAEGNDNLMYECWYKETLEDAGYAYEYWDKNIYGIPGDMELGQYNVAIWFTGNGDFYARDHALIDDERQVITDYLNAGGHLFLSGQHIGVHLMYDDTSTPESREWFNTTLHAYYLYYNSDSEFVKGVVGDPISDGFDILNIDDDYEHAGNNEWPDVIEPRDGNATTVFTYIGGDYPGKSGAIKIDTGAHRIVYFAFGFGGINTSSNRSIVMDRVIQWLERDGPTIVHQSLTDTENTMGPYQVVTKIFGENLDPTTFKVHYSINGAAYQTLDMISTGNPDEYYADIPGQPADTNIFYYIVANDTMSNTATHPDGAPLANHHFKIALIFLIVNDEGYSGDPSYNEGPYEDALDSLGHGHDLWVVRSQGAPSASYLADYPMVIWFISSGFTHSNGPLSSSSQAAITTYLDGGGKLFIIGRVASFASDGTELYDDYLHANEVGYASTDYVTGVPGDPIGDGLSMAYNSNGHQIEPDGSGLSTEIFKMDDDSCCGLKINSTLYKSVYLSYTFGWLNEENDRTTVMDRVISWLIDMGDIEKPQISCIQTVPFIQEIGGWVNISCNVSSVFGINLVKVNITYPGGSTVNQTMINAPGTDTYYYNSTYSVSGLYDFFIWADDNLGNSNISEDYTFKIGIPPEINLIEVVPYIQDTGGYVNITCTVTDNDLVNSVLINITDPNSIENSSTMISVGTTDIYYYNSTYSLNGTYSFIIFAEDNHGNGNISEESYFHIGITVVEIPMEIGWNLITVPVVNNMMASDLAENISGCQMVSWFDANSQELKTHVVAAPVYDFPLTPGYGYFILVNQNSTFTTSGTRLQDVPVQLYMGWNMIGWYNEQNTTASSLAGNITGCNMVSWFDATTQELKTHVVIAPVYDFVISKGMGLFILVDETSVWNGEG
jgi:hypothetical protein